MWAFLLLDTWTSRRIWRPTFLLGPLASQLALTPFGLPVTRQTTCRSAALAASPDYNTWRSACVQTMAGKAIDSMNIPTDSLDPPDANKVNWTDQIGPHQQFRLPILKVELHELRFHLDRHGDGQSCDYENESFHNPLLFVGPNYISKKKLGSYKRLGMAAISPSVQRCVQ